MLGVPRQAVGVEEGEEPVEQVDDDATEHEREDRRIGQLEDDLAAVGAQRDGGQGGQTEDGQGRPEEGAQPAAQIGMAEPGEDEGEECRGEGAAPRTHGSVGGAHRDAS